MLCNEGTIEIFSCKSSSKTCFLLVHFMLSSLYTEHSLHPYHAPLYILDNDRLSYIHKWNLDEHCTNIKDKICVRNLGACIHIHKYLKRSLFNQQLALVLSLQQADLIRVDNNLQLNLQVLSIANQVFNILHILLHTWCYHEDYNICNVFCDKSCNVPKLDFS